jgi:hypothetical protein
VFAVSFESRAHNDRKNWAYLDNNNSDEEDDDYDDYDSDYHERYNNPHAPTSYNGCTRAPSISLWRHRLAGECFGACVADDGTTTQCPASRTTKLARITESQPRPSPPSTTPQWLLSPTLPRWSGFVLGSLSIRSCASTLLFVRWLTV